MPPRRAAVLTISPEDDPLADAVKVDRENVADALADALENLSSMDQGTIKGILYRIPVPNGKYEWIRDVFPPFDMSEIQRSLKEEIGGGDYAIRLVAEGKPRKTVHFSIMREARASVTQTDNKTDMFSMMQFMMTQQMEAQREASRQRAEDMRERQASADRLMTAAIGVAGVALPLMLGGKDKTSELLAAVAAFQPKDSGNDLEKTVNTFAALKTIFKEDTPKEGFDASNIAGSIVNMAGPMIGAIGDAAAKFRARPAPGQGPVEHLHHEAAPPAPSFAPNPAFTRAAPAPQVEGPKNPVLDLVRQDVLYFFTRRDKIEGSAELAADTVMNIIEDARVPEDVLNAHLAPLALSPEPLDTLAAAGIDLRSDPAWAERFRAALIELYTAPAVGDDDERHDEHPERDGGGAPDAGDDGVAGEAGGAEP